MKKINRLLFVFLSFAISITALADTATVDTPAIIRYNSIHHPVIAKNGMVVTQNAIATEVGLEILKKGGNAVDSAIATAFALAVTLPRAGNIGGGGFMLVHIAKTDQQFALDYREMAPALATRDMYLDENGEVDRSRSWFSHQSAGVPGTVAGMHLAWQEWGSLPWKQLLGPAIRLAKRGMVVTHDLSSNLHSRSERLSKNPNTKSYLYKRDGSTYQAGEVLRQRDLAKTLTRIARYGAKGFYQGKTADLIVADMQANDGLITHADLKNYKPVMREVVTGQFDVGESNYHIASMPPPSSGGVHLIQMLNTLEHLPLQESGHNTG
ncbi:MAG: gamma-glutamyltransferase, partial [Gammaproteobacteria bacterium]|nr:gamma-glutamyltransferase [Gammaproteobacteria bacterium]